MNSEVACKKTEKSKVRNLIEREVENRRRISEEQ